MQRLAFPTFVTAFLMVSPAIAGPLDLTTQSQPATPVQSSVGSVFAAPPPREPVAATRYAAAGSNLGGGFLEMLFRGPAALLPQGSQQPEPQADPMMQARQSQPEQEPDGYEPAADPSQTQLPPRYLPQEVSYDGRERPGTVIINTRERLLYLVQENGRAVRYGIGVGRPGFTWAGSHTITNMREWPDWHPPAEMLAPAAASAAIHARRSRKSARRPRDVSRFDALSHSRVERTVDHRSCGVIRLHPYA